MKYLYCYIASAFLSSSIYFMFVKSDVYKKTLTHEDEIKKYDLVKKERLKIYIIANIIGLLVIGNLYFMGIGKNDPMKTTCMYTAIYFFVEYFVYTLLPKKHWMLDSVKDKKDAQDWLQKYKTMKMHYHLGLLLGVIAFGFYSYFILNKNN